MHTSNDDFNIPTELLTLAFFAVTGFFIHRNRDVFNGLVKYSTNELSTPEAGGAFGDSQLSSDCSKLISDHLIWVKKLLSLQSLPFLPDDVYEEYSLAKIKNVESWKAILAIFPELFLRDKVHMFVEFYEEIDVLFLTFVEWMENVSFISASEAERISYLQEFPFDAKIGAER